MGFITCKNIMHDNNSTNFKRVEMEVYYCKVLILYMKWYTVT